MLSKGREIVPAAEGWNRYEKNLATLEGLWFIKRGYIKEKDCMPSL